MRKTVTVSGIEIEIDDGDTYKYVLAEQLVEGWLDGSLNMPSFLNGLTRKGKNVCLAALHALENGKAKELPFGEAMKIAFDAIRGM